MNRGGRFRCLVALLAIVVWFVAGPTAAFAQGASTVETGPCSVSTTTVRFDCASLPNASDARAFRVPTIASLLLSDPHISLQAVGFSIRERSGSGRLYRYDGQGQASSTAERWSSGVLDLSDSWRIPHLAARVFHDYDSHQPLRVSHSSVATKPGASGRGLSDLGGVIEQTGTNAAGGRVFTSTGTIAQKDFAGIVNSGLSRGEPVHIITGAHGTASGGLIADAGMLADDVAAFGKDSGCGFHDVSSMTPAQIQAVMNGRGTIIGGFCNSGVCLAPRG